MASFIKIKNKILEFQFAESLHAWLEDYSHTIKENFLFEVPANSFRELLYVFHAHIHFWFSNEVGKLRDQIIQRLNSEGFYDDFYPLVDRVQTPGLYDIIEEIKGVIQLYNDKLLNLVLEDKAELFVDLEEDDLRIKECINDNCIDNEIEVAGQFVHESYYAWYFMERQTKDKIIAEYKRYIQVLNNIYFETGYNKMIEIQS